MESLWDTDSHHHQTESHSCSSRREEAPSEFPRVRASSRRLLQLLSWLPLFFTASLATAQTNPPPVSYYRYYLNDMPNQPLVTVSVSGASNVSCFTIEEDLPSPASPLSISSGGVWVPALNAIRWGPFFNTVATNVSYRLTGLPASYPVNGGAWMDGQWYFSPGVTMVTVLPAVAASHSAAAASGDPSIHARQRCQCADKRDYFLRDDWRGDLLHSGRLAADTNSTLYTGAVYLASASTVRAVAFTNGWTPSAASVAYYGRRPQSGQRASDAKRRTRIRPPRRW